MTENQEVNINLINIYI